jgi:hypothetical protein
MFEGFAWLIPLWSVHITAFLGTGFAAICWWRAMTARNREKRDDMLEFLWPFSFTILMNIGLVGGTWGGAAGLPVFQNEVLGISIARLLLCFCIALSATFLLTTFMKSRSRVGEITGLVRNFSAFLLVLNVAGVFLFALALMS